jgi:hypothetical protein
MIVLAVGVLLCVAGALTRKRRLDVGSVVMIDGVPHRVSVIETDASGFNSYGFENLGEFLGRTVLVGKQTTLGELLVKCGWQPPTPGGPA